MKTKQGCGGPPGFSLIELLTVVGIIGIMVAVALPAIARYLKTYKIRGAAQQVAGEVSRARSKAVGTNANNGVLLVTGIGGNDNQYQYWLEDDPTHASTKPAIPIPVAQGGPGGSLMTLPQGIHFVPSAGGGWVGRALRFDRLGRACAPQLSCPGSPGTDPNGTPPTIAYVNTAPAAPYTGTYTMCLKQDGTPLTMAVVVQPGGMARVVQPDSTQPCP